MQSQLRTAQYGYSLSGGCDGAHLEHNWTVAGPNGAAFRLGMKRSTLQSRMQKLGIRISRAGS